VLDPPNPNPDLWLGLLWMTMGDATTCFLTSFEVLMALAPSKLILSKSSTTKNFK
jgi:hypothetical protein